MPELPEVETTVRSLNNKVKGLRITKVWSSYNSSFHKGKNNIKDVPYFKLFREKVTGQKILGAERRAKNILIDISGGATILIHMKMTGHFLYGDFVSEKNGIHETWKPKQKTGPLSDPMNAYIRMVFSLSNGKQLAFSDLRKFAKIYFFETKEKQISSDLKHLGPDPLDAKFNLNDFKKRLLTKPLGKIKQVLMDQEIISGIGNIYSDEILWASGIHPLSAPSKIPNDLLAKAYNSMKKILEKAIQTGGDSMSDFRRLDGTPGGFQNFHKAYRLTGLPCQKKGCRGKIERIKVGSRSSHFCPVHQKLYR
jgi:formamidopyrimidine-DNA glycosylase